VVYVFIVVLDTEERASSATALLRQAGYDVFDVNDVVLLARTDKPELDLTEEVAIAAKIKGPEQTASRGVVFELGIGRSGFHKSALWEWLRR